MPGPALSVYSPFIRCGMPQANSTTSSPRWMSPLLSANGLAVLGRQQHRQAVEFLLHQFEKLEQHARAALRIGRGPAGLRGLRIGDGVLDLGMLGERDLGLHLAGVGIEHVAAASGNACDFLAADEMADLAHGALPCPIGSETSRHDRSRGRGRRCCALSHCGRGQHRHLNTSGWVRGIRATTPHPSL